MPATSRSGELLRATLLEAARRLAFEIDDHEIVACDEHLPQVQVAVEAGLAADRSDGGRLEPRFERRLRGQQRLGIGARRRAELAEPLANEGKRRGRLLTRPLDERRGVVGRERLRLERRIAARVGERDVQLGDALAERRHQGEEAAVRVGQRPAGSPAVRKSSQKRSR